MMKDALYTFGQFSPLLLRDREMDTKMQQCMLDNFISNAGAFQIDDTSGNLFRPLCALQ